MEYYFWPNQNFAISTSNSCSPYLTKSKNLEFSNIFFITWAWTKKQKSPKFREKGFFYFFRIFYIEVAHMGYIWIELE